jgi:WD40 repeat protein
VRVLLGHRESTRSLAYAPDGRTLASGGADHSVKLWDLATGAGEKIARALGAYVHALAFTPDGRRLAWACRTTVTLWDTQEREVWLRLGEHNGIVTRLAIRPDGRFLVTAAHEFRGSGEHQLEARCWDLKRGGAERTDVWARLPAELREDLTRGVWTVAFAPDGRTLAVGMAGALHLIGWPSGDYRGRLGQRGARSLAFSPDGALLAVAPRKSEVQLWDLGSPREPHTLKGHKRYPKCLAFSPDGATLVSSDMDGAIFFWDVAGRRERARYDWGIGSVWALAFAPDGMTLAAGGDKGIVISDIDPD